MKKKMIDITDELKLGLITADQAKEQLLDLFGISGSYFPANEEVQKMYDYLRMYFHRSQMNGLVDIDPYERGEIKKMLRLPDDYR